MRSFRLLFLVSLALATFVSSPAQAQFTLVNNSTSTPIPDAGHDYIHLLSETVNPANGSVSLRLNVPLPPGRRLSVPFAFAYDSNGVVVPIQSGRWSPSEGYLYSAGWSYSLPSLTATALEYPVYGSNGRQIGWCYEYTGYVFSEPTRGQNPLIIGSSQCKGTPPYLLGGNDYYQAQIGPGGVAVAVAAADGTVYNFPALQCVLGGQPLSPQPNTAGAPYSSSTLVRHFGIGSRNILRTE